jgi:PAS domain S-box-containing protein
MRASDCPTVDTTQFLLAALEQASEAIVIVDSDLCIRHFNAAAESIWGVRRAEVLGCDARCLGFNELQNGADSEITIRRSDNSRIRAQLSVSGVEIGGRANYMVFVRDTTAEVERRERIALLNLVADKTNRAVVVTDRKLQIIYTNAAFSGLFGYSPEEAQGRQAHHLLGGRFTDRKTLGKLPRRIFDDSGAEEEILAYDKNGDEIWVSAMVKPFRSARGRVKYIFALLTDISENKQLRSLQQLIMGALADELPITEIADQLCRRVETIAPDVVASVLHVDSDGLVHPLGGPSQPDDYSRALEGIAIGPDVGSCGSAAYYGKPVLAENLDTDPRWQPYKTRPLAVGLKACWSTPIKAKDGRVIGTFAFYFREPRRRAAGISGLSTPAFTSVRWRSSERKPGPRSPGSPTTTC